MSPKWTNGDSTSKIKYAIIRCATNMINNAADAFVMRFMYLLIQDCISSNLEFGM